jgi:hypothetical protein
MLDMKSQNKIYVIPAEAGIQQVINQYTAKSHWIPAFAGMTRKWGSSGVSSIVTEFAAKAAPAYLLTLRSSSLVP